MQRHYVRFLRFGLVTAALAVLPLAGCTSSGFGGSSAFGGKSQDIAELKNKGNYDNARALSEARGHFRKNNFGYSAAFYKRVVELSPHDPEGYVGLGASYDQLRRFDLADRVYAALHRISGDTVQYYNNLGYSHMLRGDLKAAYVHFQKAGKLDPDSIVVANNMQLLADAAADLRA